MKIDGTEYNFTPTYDVNATKDYNGFIGQDGEFYLVSNKKTHKPSHNDWAKEYLFYIKDKLTDPKKVRKIIEGELTYKGSINYLINYMGFIYYSHSTNKDRYNKPIIIYPKKQTFKPAAKVTDKQKKMLYSIMHVNGEDDYIPKDINEEIKKEEHLNYVDNFIEKEIEKGEYK